MFRRRLGVPSENLSQDAGRCYPAGVQLGSTLLLFGPLVAGGCLSYESDGDAKVPGHELGTYEVVATLTESTCGVGAFGSSDVWRFPVRLSRDTDELFWLNGREVILGRIAEDGKSFSFDTWVEVEVSAARGTRAGCTLTRTDRALGELATSGDDVSSFSGSLDYRFGAAEGADCSDLGAMPDGLAALPCEISYAMNATRVVAPEG